MTSIVIITSKQNSATLRESNGGNTARQLIILERAQLGASTEVKDATRGVLAPGADAVAIREPFY